MKEFPDAHKMFEQPILTKYFNNLTDNFRSPHIWYYEKKDSNQVWHLRHTLK